ncbi:hypothetical protein HNV12_09500 [Methanococcoides sp. SA1]|nr:hypothetical protein [Methanococcoides sp. SA1]
MRDSKLDLFLIFIKGDYRISRKYAESKKGLPIKGLDLPLFRYVLSLQERIQRLKIIYLKIAKAHKETLEETQQVEIKGYGSHIKSTELNIYYEVFFNEIYSIMENVSRINLFMFENPGSIPPKFSKQIKKIKSGDLSFSPEYDKLIREEMEWFNDVSRIRDNANHFLTGLVVFDRTDDGKPIPKYLNYNISERKKHESDDPKIEMNISNSVAIFFENTIKFLDKISSIYIERMDKDVPCHITYFKDGEVEIRSITYNDYVAGNDGEYVTTLINPKKDK